MSHATLPRTRPPPSKWAAAPSVRSNAQQNRIHPHKSPHNEVRDA
jgi:hypothetical protein